MRAFESSSRGAGGDEPTALHPRPCPRDATHEEWETWHASLTWEQQLRRGDLDPPEHDYSDADIAKSDAREARRRAQRWDPDPFSYAEERRDGPWPRVDQIEVPALSNTWRMDPAGGYSPGGFARRMRQVPYRELIEERPPFARSAIRLRGSHGSSKRSSGRRPHCGPRSSACYASDTGGSRSTSAAPPGAQWPGLPSSRAAASSERSASW